MSEAVFCYACGEQRVGTPVYGTEDCRLCPECGSEFIEILDAEPAQSTSGQPRLEASSVTRPSTFFQSANVPAISQSFSVPGRDARISFRIFATPFGPNGISAVDIPSLLSQAGAGSEAAVYGVRVNEDGSFSTPVQVDLGNFASGDALEQLLDQLVHQHQPALDPATPEVVQALPKLQVASPGVLLSSANDEEGKPFAACTAGDHCSVCHSVFCAGETVTQLHCKHCFHGDCITPWLRSHNSCPVCRRQLPREPQPEASVNSHHVEDEQSGISPEGPEQAASGSASPTPSDPVVAEQSRASGENGAAPPQTGGTAGGAGSEPGIIQQLGRAWTWVARSMSGGQGR
mmetsp:Transcript_1610/g.3708  ORF Transcript_1610/g.3708 Transcript_1610/m.3708 type:complete len:346 (-) Transcript_1610:166-1203(-)